MADIKERLVLACRLLLSTNKKICEIATECSFSSGSSFSAAFSKLLGISPSLFRAKYTGRVIHTFSTLNDVLLMMKMPFKSLLDNISDVDCAKPFIHVNDPSDETGHFLHEAAIIEYRGVLYSSWYNNIGTTELDGYTPIRERRSFDGGKTWSDFKTVASDESGKILYCPPIYGICDGKLYMFINEMVSADRIHSLDLYVLNNETDTFEKIRSYSIPFKINTNVICLPNGKLIIPGRISDTLDGFPSTPAILISDSGKINAEWRLVKVAKNDVLSDGSSLVHSETTVICSDNTLYMFNRNDNRGVPLMYISKDFGESWSEAIAHDIPYVSSKIYSGQLSDGRFYLIANIDSYERNKLALYVSEKNKVKFNKRVILCDCSTPDADISRCHYPASVESNGILYVVASADYKRKSGLAGRGCVLFKVDLSDI